MGVLTFTVTQSPTGGHVVSDVVQLETQFQQIDPMRRIKKTEQESLSGYVESDLDHRVTIYKLTTDVVAEANKLFWLEFFDSVANREQFTVDLTGTIAAPGTSLNVTLESGGYEPSRQGMVLSKFSFSVKEQ